MKRRNFLTLLASTGIALPSIGAAAPPVRTFAHAASPDNPLNGAFASPVTQATDNVLVILRLFGGNDGLNTFIPYNDENYYYARRKAAEQDLSIRAEDVVKIHNSNTMGFHPALKPLHTLYGEGKVCVVQNVGYPEQDLSHFRSNDIWLSGTNADEYKESGWLGRFLEERYPDYPNVLPEDPFAVEVGRNLGRTFMGEHTHLGVNIADTSFVPAKPQNRSSRRQSPSQIEQEYIRQMMLQTSTFLQSALRAEAKVKGNRVRYPDEEWAKNMAFVARMIGGGMKTQVYLVNMPLWDFHLDQLRDQNEYLGRLANAMYAFQRDIEAFGIADRVTMLTVSEFGRRVTPTQSGTDHGSGSCLFAVGQGVKGGIIGTDPDLSRLDANENLRWVYDFRQIYASVLGQWFGASVSDMSSALMRRRFGQLPIFKNNQLRTVDVAEMHGTTISVYPQPASEVLTIELPDHIASLSSSNYAVLKITTLHGQEVLPPQMLYSSPVAVNVRSLPSGIYLASVETPRERFTAKIQVLR